MKTFEEFIRAELTGMKNNIYNGAISNLSNRKYNPFHVFSEEDKDIVKYMALGRSFDSQLGNRLQRIAMYGARLRYGKENVPNYIFLKSDVNNGKIIYWTYSFDDEMDIINFNNDDNEDESDSLGINVYKTQTYYTAKDKKDCVRQIMNKTLKDKLCKIIKEKYNIDKFNNKENKAIRDDYLKEFEIGILNSIIEHEEEVVELERHDEITKHVKKVKPVDLMFFNDSNEIFLFEIKAGGDLDSKNCEKNADEVNEDRDIFSFIKVNSYFATCYNNRGEGNGDTEIINDGVQYRGNRPVGGIFTIYTKRNKSGECEWENMRGNILVGSVFWEMVLPNGMKYRDFKEMYERAFQEVGLVEMLKGICFE